VGMHNDNCGVEMHSGNAKWNAHVNL
jgi:hypothetical protein